MGTCKETKTADRYLVPAVDQATRILFSLSQAESSYMSLTEICTAVGIHKSKAFSILNTLQRSGLIQKNQEGKGYGLGPGLIGLSRRFLDNLSAPRLSEPLLEDLARRSGGTAAFGMIVEKYVFVAAKHEGGRAMGIAIRIGHRFPVSYGGHGKAIAAFLPPDELALLLTDEKLYFHGDPSSFDGARLAKEIEECRARWYAEDMEEMVPGLNAVAAPVLGPRERPIGYMVVMGLSADAIRQTGPLVAEAARTLSRQLGATVNGVRSS
jgi:DNA-binding IclR family transcriptional regulator